MVASLSLFYRRIQTHDEKHLTTIFVREEEQSQHRRHRNFVVKRFTVKLEERIEYFDIISTTETETISQLNVFYAD